jgi:hypothetical protein
MRGSGSGAFRPLAYSAGFVVATGCPHQRRLWGSPAPGGDHGILRLTACGHLSPSTSVHFTRRMGHGQAIPTL